MFGRNRKPEVEVMSFVEISPSYIGSLGGECEFCGRESIGQFCDGCEGVVLRLREFLKAENARKYVIEELRRTRRMASVDRFAVS